MTLKIHNDILAFVVGFLVGWWWFTHHQPTPRADKREPDANFKAFDKRSPVIPQQKAG